MSKHTFRKHVQSTRGTAGTIETCVQIDSAGVRSQAGQIETLIHWPSIFGIDVTPVAVSFLYTPHCILQVPLRVFSDAAALERFVAFAKNFKQR